MSPITVRHLRGLKEFVQAVEFQEATWGKGFSERVPKSLMKVTQRLGGVVGGAFDDEGRMIGFVYGMTGIERGRTVHWSDILAVKPGLRDGGVGRRLKLFQREAVLELGVTRMYWTFDPLESRNAYLNLARLGALSREYVPDMYGQSNSVLHRGLGTDRFVVTWELDSQRVVERLSGEAPPPLAAFEPFPRAFEVEIDGAGGMPRPIAPGGPPVEARRAAGGFLVPIPTDIQELRDRDPSLAAEWRSATRAVLDPSVREGWEVRELVRGPDLSYYVVVPSPGHVGAPAADTA